MLANFYQKNIIEKPKLVFLILLISLIFFGYFSKNFRPYEIGKIISNKNKVRFNEKIRWT